MYTRVPKRNTNGDNRTKRTAEFSVFPFRCRSNISKRNYFLQLQHHIISSRTMLMDGNAFTCSRKIKSTSQHRNEFGMRSSKGITGSVRVYEEACYLLNSKVFNRHLTYYGCIMRFIRAMPNEFH